MSFRNKKSKQKADIEFDSSHFNALKKTLIKFFHDTKNPFYGYEFQTRIIEIIGNEMGIEQKKNSEIKERTYSELEEYLKNKGYEPYQILQVTTFFKKYKEQQSEIEDHEFIKGIEKILNVISKLEGLKPEFKSKVLEILMDIDTNKKEERNNVELKNKLFKYATDGYKELYEEYESENDIKKLEQLQDIIFQKNNGKIECYFKHADIYVSEQILNNAYPDESEIKMNSLRELNSEYDYPSEADLDVIVDLCPGEGFEDDMYIISQIIFTDSPEIYIKESFRNKKRRIYNLEGKGGEKVNKGDLYASTYAIRKGNLK